MSLVNPDLLDSGIAQPTPHEDLTPKFDGLLRTLSEDMREIVIGYVYDRTFGNHSDLRKQQAMQEVLDIFEPSTSQPDEVVSPDAPLSAE